jgi:hypothetical protein
MIIAGCSETDTLGRRDVGWKPYSGCEGTAESTGFSFQTGAQGILHLVYENEENPDDVFGTFYACYGGPPETYGPRLFYRNAAETTPEGCGELLLVPRW